MKFKIEGIEAVQREIESLSDDKMKRREILKILRRQAKPILSAIQANTPEADKVVTFRGVEYDPGNLRRSMAIKTGRSKDYPNVLVGPRQTKKGKTPIKYDGFYAFWIQYGTIYQKPNDFIWKAAAPLLDSVHTTASAETKKYIEKKIRTLNL